MPPDVTVIVPAFNYARFLPETLGSVLDQTFVEWECIVVDDGSTDETGQVVQGFVASDGRFRYERQENRGLAATRNRGVALASGRYIQFLDADDLIAPDKLGAQVAILDGDAVDVSYSNFFTFDSNTGKPIARYEGRLVGDNPLGDFLFHWERGLTIPIHAALFRRDLWPDAAVFDETLRAKEDWVMWVGLALRGARLSYLDRDLALYRQHGENMCRNQAEMTTQFARAALKIAAMIPPELATDFASATTAYLDASLDRLTEAWSEDRRRREQEMEAITAQHGDLARQHDELRRREEELRRREEALEQHDQELLAAQQALARREEGVRAEESRLSAGAASMAKEQEELRLREEELVAREKQLLAARQDVIHRSKDIRVREKALAVKLEDFEASQQEMRSQEEDLVARRGQVVHIEERLGRWEQELKSLADTLDEGRKFVVASAAGLEAERRALAESGAEVRARRLANDQKEDELAARQRRVDEGEAELAERRAALVAVYDGRISRLEGENAELRASLARVEGSRVWRLGQLYWRLRYHLGLGRR